MLNAEAHWISIYRLGAVAALLAVLFGVLEILITFIPGGERVSPELLTVPLRFARLQANPLLELRNLGLVNIFLTSGYCQLLSENLPGFTASGAPGVQVSQLASV